MAVYCLDWWGARRKGCSEPLLAFLSHYSTTFLELISVIGEYVQQEACIHI